MREFVSRFFDKTFWKFIIVGVANTLFGSAIMFVLYNVFKCGYWISSAANYIFGSVLSYFLNKHFTFRNKDKSFNTVWKFVINILMCYLLAYGIAKPAVRWILTDAGQKIQDNLSMLVGMAMFVVLNYVGQRFWTFKEQTD